MKFEFLETPRLLLRKMTPAEYEYIYSNYSHQDCMDFLGLSTQEELDAEKERYKKGLSAYDRTFVIFHMLLKESQQLIGLTGFVRYYPAHHRAELGYSILREEFKNKGYMSEACETMLNYGFNELGLNRIEAMVGPSNLPSLKIIEKLNFKKEGQLKQHYYRNGSAEDSLIYALLKSEYTT